jgi:hypothetical protein
MANTPDHDAPQAETDRELLLAALRSAALRARLDENELNTIGVALRHGMISPEYAVEWLQDIGITSQVLR